MKFVLYTNRSADFLPLAYDLQKQGHAVIFSNPRFFRPQQTERTDVVLAGDLPYPQVNFLANAYVEKASLLAIQADTPAQEILDLTVTPAAPVAVDDNGILAAPEAETEVDGGPSLTEYKDDTDAILNAIWPYARSRGGWTKTRLRRRINAGETYAICLELDLEPSTILGVTDA